MLFVKALFSLLIFLVSIWGKKDEFDPYADNKGTIVGVAGEDFIVIAADMRLPDGFVIRSRSINRLFELGTTAASSSSSSTSSPMVLASAGCWSDSVALHKAIEGDIRRFRWENKAEMSVNALAHLLSSTLFSRRTFPYYTFCVIAGFDREGCGAIYRYDAIGSFERVSALCVGNGEALLQPMLDDALERGSGCSIDKRRGGGEGEGERGGGKAMGVVVRDRLWKISDDGEHFEDEVGEGEGELGMMTHAADGTNGIGRDEAVSLVVDVFKAAAEREISIGDGINIWVLERPKTETETETKEGGGGGAVRAGIMRPPRITKSVVSLPSH
jgi:20S proteasome subunit beta 6